MSAAQQHLAELEDIGCDDGEDGFAGGGMDEEDDDEAGGGSGLPEDKLARR
jgi:hypothetical protein